MKTHMKRKQRAAVIGLLIAGIGAVPALAWFGFHGGPVFDVSRYAKNQAWLAQLQTTLESMGIKIKVLQELQEWQEKTLTDLYQTTGINPNPTGGKLDTEFDKIIKESADLPGTLTTEIKKAEQEFIDKWFPKMPIPTGAVIEQSLSKERLNALKIFAAGEAQRTEDAKIMDQYFDHNKTITGEKDGLQLANEIALQRARAKIRSAREDMTDLRYQTRQDQAEQIANNISEAQNSHAIGTGFAPPAKEEKRMKESGAVEEKRRPVQRF